MKKVLVLVSLIALASIWAWAADIPADKDVIKFEAKVGVATFNHKEHAERGIDCVTCHHKTEGDATPEACGKCHDKKEVKEEAPKLKDAVHKTCWDCHTKLREEGKDAGPVKKWEKKAECKKCHIKPKK